MSRVPLGNSFAGTSTLLSRLTGPVTVHMNMVLELPALMEPGNARLQRVMNRIIKECLKEELIHHHAKRIPHHFDPFKQKKYKFAKRDPKTVERKKQRKGKAADLVQTGRTKRRVKSRIDIRTTGSASKGNVGATGRVSMKVGMERTKEANDVSIDQMASEIQAVTSQEANEIAISFSERFIRKLDSALSARVKRRLSKNLIGRAGAKFGALGIR